MSLVCEAEAHQKSTGGLILSVSDLSMLALLP